MPCFSHRPPSRPPSPPSWLGGQLSAGGVEEVVMETTEQPFRYHEPNTLDLADTKTVLLSLSTTTEQENWYPKCGVFC